VRFLFTFSLQEQHCVKIVFREALKWLHLDRAVGGHRHHCHPHRPFVAGRAESPRSRRPFAMSDTEDEEEVRFGESENRREEQTLPS